MRKFAIHVLVLLTLCNCKDNEDPKPVEVVSNGNVDTGVSFPTLWLWYNGKGKYQTTWNNETFSSPDRSLSIATAVSDPVDFAYWAQEISQNIPVGKKLILKARVKGNNVIGNGVSIAVRADSESTTGLKFATTQGNKLITGTFDWTEYRVEMLSVPAETKRLYIFLVYLNGTTGEVFFDDISMTAE
jgi:hypothetical protein